MTFQEHDGTFFLYIHTLSLCLFPSLSLTHTPIVEYGGVIFPERDGNFVFYFRHSPTILLCRTPQRTRWPCCSAVLHLQHIVISGVAVRYV